MNSDIFQNISKIVERDSKVTTYKFALLRGVIDMIQDNSPFITFSSERVFFPTGILIEKWLLYYYPILESKVSIPQIHGNVNLAFGGQFENLIDYYKSNGGFSAFYNDLTNKSIPDDIKNDFIDLAKKLRGTITGMPMKHIGFSITEEYYSLFKYENTRIQNRISESVDLVFLIKNFGTFSIPKEYYEAFQVIGSFVSGQDSLLFKWAEFSVNASKHNLSIDKVLNDVLKNPITEREIAESKNFYKSILRKEGKVYCVWSGDSISRYDIDHMIPFSVWKNNDLWNLLPSRKTTNNDKRDKIPSPELVERKKDIITYYWQLIYDNNPQRFRKEIQVALLGNNTFESWQDTAIMQLQRSCEYLISVRGFAEWKNI